jgi:hypothetical protein
VAPLKPSKVTDFDTDCTLDLEKRFGSFEHIPNLKCAQHMYSKCEAVDDLSIDCKKCGDRIHIFLEDTVLLSLAALTIRI